MLQVCRWLEGLPKEDDPSRESDEEVDPSRGSDEKVDLSRESDKEVDPPPRVGQKVLHV